LCNGKIKVGKKAKTVGHINRGILVKQGTKFEDGSWSNCYSAIERRYEFEKAVERRERT